MNTRDHLIKDLKALQGFLTVKAENAELPNALKLCKWADAAKEAAEIIAEKPGRDEIISRLQIMHNWAIGTPKENREWYTDTVYWHRCLTKDYDDMMAELDNPEYSAYVNPVYEWRENADPGQPVGSTWECPYCHMNYHEQAPWNPRKAKWHYCPNCGKRMGKQDDD